MGDAYSWTTSGSGNWNTTSNWFDLTTQTVASNAPGAADTATVNGPGTGSLSVAGPGSALNLTVNENVTLTGSYTLGTFVIANPGGVPSSSTTSNIALTGQIVAQTITIGTAFQVPGFSETVGNAGDVQLGTNSALSAASLGLAVGDLAVAGGDLDISGGTTLGVIILSPRTPVPPAWAGAIDVSNGGTADIGGLTITDGSVSVDATSTLEIGDAGSAAAGTITIDPGARVSAGSPISSVGTVSFSGPILNNGTFGFFAASALADVVNNGSLNFEGTTLSNSVNNGSIFAFGGTLSAISGTGEIAVQAALTVGPNVSGTVDLESGRAILDIALGTDVPVNPGDTPLIAGFANRGSIVLQGVTADSSNYSSTGPGIGTLTLDNAGTAVASLALLGTYTTGEFALSTGAAGTTITLPCFAAGTRIRTRRGDVAVELLRLDDEVATLLGKAFRPIRWIGHRTVRIAGHPRPKDVLPIRIEANAFATGLPRRQLLLSPDHAIFTDDVLIPVKYLVNGSTISQRNVRSISYWHVELDAHDVILAEGLPTESYLDTGDRSHFANCGPVTTLHPCFASLAWEAEGCAPLVITGPIVEQVRQRLMATPSRPPYAVAI